MYGPWVRVPAGSQKKRTQVRFFRLYTPITGQFRQISIYFVPIDQVDSTVPVPYDIPPFGDDTMGTPQLAMF